MGEKIPNEALGRLDSEAFRSAEKLPVHVILDNVRSAQNVGSVFRTMDAFRGEKMHLCGISAVPPHREINKTALGAAHTVDWEYHDSTVDAVKKLQREGFRVYAVEQVRGAMILGDAPWTFDPKPALVFGNEVEGVSDDVVKVVDGCIEIEQFGTKHSLNIAVCCGIVLWNISRHFDYKVQ